MKKFITTAIATLVLSAAAHAQSQDDMPAVAPTPAASAASAPEAASPASAPVDGTPVRIDAQVSEPTVPKEVVVVQGRIRDLLPHCDKQAVVSASTGESVLSNVVTQLSNKVGVVGFLQVLAASAVGSAIGGAIEEKTAVNCKIEVEVRLLDGSDRILKSIVPQSVGRSLRVFQKGEVRIEDGTPSFWFN